MKNVILLLKNQKQLKEERLKTAHYPKEIEPIVKQDVKDIDEAIQILSERSKNTETSDNQKPKQLNILGVSTSLLLETINSFAGKYQISLQLWGIGNNNFYISKDDIDLKDGGGFETPKECMVELLQYLYRINRTLKSDRVC